MTLSRPSISFDYFRGMCDDTGMFQHAIFDVPDRRHGYCIDDCARALIVLCGIAPIDRTTVDDALATEMAAFIEHGWNRDVGRFRNFMHFNRNWLEDYGSEDSHARTLWALGVTLEQDFGALRQVWASGLFADAMRSVAEFASPRAWAFTLLGLDGYCKANPGDTDAGALRLDLVHRLQALLDTIATDDWVWFENSLSYDNARLSQAMIVSGLALGEQRFVGAGLRSLSWLLRMQSAPEGHFRPIGSAGFGLTRKAQPLPFDQQPVEVPATVAACLAAFRADGDRRWHTEALRAHDWLFGRNDLGKPLVDAARGTCCDGLHPDRVNLNCGAESVISALLSQQDLDRFID